MPTVDFAVAKTTFAAVHHAIYTGLVRACHDLSEGGLGAAAAEMAFAGGLGARISLDNMPTGATGCLPASVLLFSESNSRFLCEVRKENAAAFEAALAQVPHAQIGEVTQSARLEIRSGNQPAISADIADLKEAWQSPLRW